MAAEEATARARRWNHFYERQREGVSPPWDPGAPCSQLVQLVEGGRLELPRRACELGCGAAHCGEFLAKHGCEQVDALDIAPDAVALARARCAGVHGLYVHCADLLSLLDAEGRISAPVSAEYGRPAAEDEAYDLVFDCQCFHVLRQVDEARLARTMARLLRPGGQLVIMAGNAAEPERNPGLPVLTRTECTAALQAAGLRLEALEETRFDPTPLYGDNPPLAWLAIFRKPARQHH